MKVTIREVSQEIDIAVRDRMTKDVTDAPNAVTVGGPFVVNDTQCSARSISLAFSIGAGRLMQVFSSAQ
jgi:hypothetical protein